MIKNKVEKQKMVPQNMISEDDVTISDSAKKLVKTARDKVSEFQAMHFSSINGEIKEIPAEYKCENLFQLELKASSISGDRSVFEGHSENQAAVFEKWIDENVAEYLSEDERNTLKGQIGTMVAAVDDLNAREGYRGTSFESVFLLSASEAGLNKINKMYVPEQLQAGFSDMIDEYVHFNESARDPIMERMTPDYMVVGIALARRLCGGSEVKRHLAEVAHLHAALGGRLIAARLDRHAERDERAGVIAHHHLAYERCGCALKGHIEREIAQTVFFERVGGIAFLAVHAVHQLGELGKAEVPLISAAGLDKRAVGIHQLDELRGGGAALPGIKEMVGVALLHHGVKQMADGRGRRGRGCGGNSLLVELGIVQLTEGVPRAALALAHRVEKRTLDIGLVGENGLDAELCKLCAVLGGNSFFGKRFKQLERGGEVKAHRQVSRILAGEHGHAAGIGVALVAVDAVDDLDGALGGQRALLRLGEVRGLALLGKKAVEDGEILVDSRRPGILVHQEGELVVIVPEHVVAEHLREKAQRHHGAALVDVGDNVHLDGRAVGERDGIRADDMSEAHIAHLDARGARGGVIIDDCTHGLDRGAHRHHGAAVLEHGHRVGGGDAFVVQKDVDLTGGSAELLERRGTLLGLSLGKLGFQCSPVEVIFFRCVRGVGGNSEGECQR